jgi:hypothetical protein
MKRTLITLCVVALFNFLLIFFCIQDGLDDGDVMLRFREREAVTFMSALLLGLGSLASLVLYLLKRKMPSADKGFRFWLMGAVGFFYLCMDEYFMAHEGMDEMVGSLFGRDVKALGLDGLVIGAFGVLAAGLCFYFRRELLRHREMLPFLFLGGFFLLGTVVFDQLWRLEDLAVTMEVIEESLKIVGVSFFFTAFLTALTSFINKTSVHYKT